MLAKVRSENMADSFLPEIAVAYFEALKNRGQTLNILVIGEQGSGKTTLVNNLLGEEIAKEEEDASVISSFKGVVQGVGVTVYEASGFLIEDEQGRRQLQELVHSGSITFILYCFKMSETRMRQSLTDTFKVFNSAGVNWSKTVIALTFADSLPVPKATRHDPNFAMKQHFVMRVKEWKDQVHCVLTSEVGVPMQTAGLIAMLPTAGDLDELLPNGEEWCSALWSALLAAPTNEFVKQSVNHHRTNSDSVLQPLAVPYYSVTPSPDQQQVVSAKGIAALCLAVVVIGAFAFGGITAGALVAVGSAVVWLVSKGRGLL